MVVYQLLLNWLLNYMNLYILKYFIGKKWKKNSQEYDGCSVKGDFDREWSVANTPLGGVVREELKCDLSLTCMRGMRTTWTGFREESQKWSIIVGNKTYENSLKELGMLSSSRSRLDAVI